MLTMTVEIKSTFDIAIARNKLRSQLLNNLKLSPLRNARAAIVITALGELLIAMNMQKAVPVELQLEDKDDQQYFGYSCSIPVSDIENQTYHRYQVNLEHISHSFSLQTGDKYMEIKGQVLLGVSPKSKV